MKYGKIEDKDVTVLEFPQMPMRWRCHYCKHLNRVDVSAQVTLEQFGKVLQMCPRCALPHVWELPVKFENN